MKRRWFGAGALVVAACAISVFSARRIEAQFSSPVKVVNTTSAPAIASSMDDHGRIPYWSVVFGGTPFGGGTSCSGQNACQFIFGPVPSGHRLVIEHTSGALDLSGLVSELIVQLRQPNPTTANQDTYSSFDAPTTTGYFDMPTLGYLDSQQSVDVDVFLRGGGTFGVNSRLVLAGYLLDCTAAPCAAIAH